MKSSLLVFLLALPALAEEISLYPGVAPDSEGLEVLEKIQDRGGLAGRRISDVTRPTITLHLPPKEKANGAAVIICPGGGYGGVVIDKEGHMLARWFNTFGVAGITLKYRLPNAGGTHLGHEVPLRDAQRAIRMVRHNAKAWNIDPERIGIMGFSAGGHLASTAATHFEDGPKPLDDAVGKHSARPDFQILVYPVISLTPSVGHTGSRKNLLGKDQNNPERISWYSNETRVTPETPPAFLVHTRDDGVKIQNSLMYQEACRKAGVPVGAAFYPKGGHGYGLNPTGTAVESWPIEVLDWMEREGLVPDRNRGFAFDEGDKVLFLGDSITAGGTYVDAIESYVYRHFPARWVEIQGLGLASETVSGLTEDGHPFPRPDLHERLDRVLAETKPDIVLACYGMNCGIYQPFSEARFTAYQKGIEKLIAKCRAAKADVVLITPPPYQYNPDKPWKHDPDYNATLQRYADWLLQIKQEGVRTIDIRKAMSAQKDACWGADGVHPTRHGHLVMARAILAGLGAEKGLSTEQLDALLKSELGKRINWQRTIHDRTLLNHIGHKRPGTQTKCSMEQARLEHAKIQAEIDEMELRH